MKSGLPQRTAATWHLASVLARRMRHDSEFVRATSPGCGCGLQASGAGPWWVSKRPGSLLRLPLVTGVGSDDNELDAEGTLAGCRHRRCRPPSPVTAR
jgi:hypothetical protein